MLALHFRWVDESLAQSEGNEIMREKEERRKEEKAERKREKEEREK